VRSCASRSTLTLLLNSKTVANVRLLARMSDCSGTQTEVIREIVKPSEVLTNLQLGGWPLVGDS
jgi:hypothetical protein